MSESPRVLKPSPNEVKRFLPEYREVLRESGGHKPIKFVDRIEVLRCPAPFNPSAQGDFAFTSSYSWDGKILSRGPAFSYDTMLATRVNPYERIVTVIKGVRVWITTYDGQWGGHWSRVHVYMNMLDFDKLLSQVKGELKPHIDLTERQMKILATVRAYKSDYRKDVFRRNRVTVDEMQELNRLGLIDARGAITRSGKLVVGTCMELI